MEPLTIQLHDSLSRRKRPLQLEQPDRVTLYVCGPTVYDLPHIGNARPAVVFDVLVRLLRHAYRQVIYVRNFTDVDDKINAAAATAGVPIRTITERTIAAYQADMRALDVLPPDREPRVTEHISDIQFLITQLLDRGHAYVAAGHVLFEVASFASYGQLSGRTKAGMQAGARVEVAPFKRDPTDFVLWKPSSPDLPGWESPWGRGRPGWHVECTAMIQRHLGFPIDIHGGGQDLIFPHHENEIAQGCAATGLPYCRTWMHNSFITVAGQKMSKSLGNVLLVRDLLQMAPGEAIRLALLASHYRQPLDWNQERLDQARRTLIAFYRALSSAVTGDEHRPCAAESRPDPIVLGALADDLNISVALARLHGLSRELQWATSAAERGPLRASLLGSGQLLGLLQKEPHKALAGLCSPPRQVAASEAWLSEEAIAELQRRRQRARQEGDFSLADRLRRQLIDAGVPVADSKAVRSIATPTPTDP
ncbi:cysteine--tRNA ligase [Synechococcus sp. ATX 2A4]|uniref:cysteine--tRNA ligase n=1 Tax=Synechococcus sp. ATX 2A4 TaxID=2823727 RepID=UPI0020CC83C3|nr:cysteine--tRNA ligase [Synechococcus sp. ATX 2A4]MCP9885082.1 cysteine--tRNA ligase [Synechococcus sp. ATX 2A4]